MTRKQRAALNRAVQQLVDAEVAHAYAYHLGKPHSGELLTALLKARLHFKRMLDKHLDPVVPPTKKD